MTSDSVITLTATDGSSTAVEVDVLASHIETRCSFVRFYDAAETQQDGHIHPQDWALPALLQAPWQSAEPYDRVLETPADTDRSNWRAIDELLSKVEPTWSLEDERADEMYRPAVLALLKRAMSTPWVKAAVATKLLHKKRPNLIPVVDREVWGYYRPTDSQNTYPSASQVCDVMFGNFLGDLRSNSVALGELQDALGRCDGLPPLTKVRLLEMTVWLVRRRRAAVLGSEN